MSGPLDGRTAVVTGAAGGLGHGIVGRLAADGATVICADVDTDGLEALVTSLTRTGGHAVGVECDQRDLDAVGRLAEAADDLGGADILINNAAVYASRPWTEITPEEWDRTLEVNLRGYFLCARALHPQLQESAAGRIVNVASLTFFVGFAELLDYVASKGGIIGFTRTLAREVGPDGITVNAISPGAFPTAAEAIHPDPAGYNQWVLDQQALKRRGTPEDIGNLVGFLASDAASFITGQTIGIDGGWVTH
ncbi:SDR family NAD(P)-dependent oxidoreductase [Euzebya tangerina]|uniref:SDR family NAD(P)-dependent oxidoreductase n=1 Tax=Euzebya tangerina TaxID=591198 RepID=UPI000E312E12|nr:glucose 1-dehydrogenase [Euzebya tangerina]